MGNKDFKEKVCAPLKLLEVWDRLMRKRYGSVCSLSTAYSRLMEMLTNLEGLKLVAAVAAAGIPLHGTGPANPGVPQCFAIVAEFDRCKAGSLPPPSRVRTAEELAEEDAQKRKEAEERTRAESEAKAALDRQAKEDAQLDELATGWFSMAPADGGTQASQESAAGVSAADTAALAALQEDKARVMFATTSAELMDSMRGPLGNCSRAAVVIAAPTSGWSVIGTYMECARDLSKLYKEGSGCSGGQTKFRVVILAGPRFDVLAKIQEKGKELWPNWFPFLTLIQRREKQSWAARAAFAITFVEKNEGEVPTTLTVPKTSVHVAVTEGTTLRCRCAQCPFREGPAPGNQEDPDAVLVSEISADDRVHSELERLQQELADAEEENNADVAGETGGSVSALPEQGADILVDLWPFAYNTSYWRCILEGLMEGSRTGVLAILSPSAHPGCWVASRRLAQDVFVCSRRFSNHSRRHALKLYEDLRRQDLAPAQSAEESTPAATTSLGVMQISASSSPHDVLEAYDVSTGELWRDGLNLTQLHGEAFNQQAARLVGSQMEQYSLAISAVNAKFGRGLDASKMFRDGEAVPASALFFDTEGSLKMWLGHTGHNKYSDRVVVIKGIQKQGVPITVYAVLIGAVQFVNSFCGIRRGPNAKLVFTPTKGFNEGALELIITTRNGAGVAKGSPIVIDYGLPGDFAGGPSYGGPSSPGGQGSSGPGISGALDAIFDQQREALPDEAAKHVEEQKKEAAAAGEAAKAAAEAERKRKAEEEAREADAKRRKVEEEEARKKRLADEAARAAGVRGNADGTLVCTISQPKCEVRLVDNESILVLASLESTNKKVTKHCVLVQWSQHVNMTSRTDDGLVWAVKPKDLVLVKESGAVMPLKKAMADTYSSYAQIFGYDAFVAGALPKDLKALTGRPFRVDFSHASFNSDRGAIKKQLRLPARLRSASAFGLCGATMTRNGSGHAGLRL